MGQATIVYVLISFYMVAPHKHPSHERMMKEHIAVFGSFEHCNAERQAMDLYTVHDGTYLCEKELLK